MTELIIVGLLLSLFVSGIWGVYFGVANTYVIKQRAGNIQNEGKWILDLIENGGNFRDIEQIGRRIYGLKSMVPVDNSDPEVDYPNVGDVDSTKFNDTDDYRIEFQLDGAGTANTRFAEFSVEFNGALPTSKLFFRLKDPGEDDYEVMLTDRLLMQREDSPQDETIYGPPYNRTSFKAELISSASPYVGINVSFYLVQHPIRDDSGDLHIIGYNYRLDRKVAPDIEDDFQKSTYLSAIPYPQYFSKTIYFPNDEQ